MKNPMYAEQALDTTGFGESLPTASTTPSSRPTSIASTVNTTVFLNPVRIDALWKYPKTTLHWKFLLVSSVCTNMASSTTTTTVDTQRP